MLQLENNNKSNYNHDQRLPMTICIFSSGDNNYTSHPWLKLFTHIGVSPSLTIVWDSPCFLHPQTLALLLDSQAKYLWDKL